MYSRLKIGLKFLKYYFTASNGRGHGIHSPFVFTFVRQVLNDRRKYPEYKKIALLRERMLKDHRLLEVVDYGGGSGLSDAEERSLSEIARYSSSTPSFGRLLFRIARYYQSGTIFELGTSLGLSAAYLGEGNPSGQVFTVEGSPAIAAGATEHFNQLNRTNITSLVGNFDECLEKILSDIPLVELAFIDGNHREEPLLRYFELLLKHKSAESIIVLHDIHWSRQMERAWKTIQCDPRVMLTVDLFFGGIVFFSDQFKVKQHFVIRAV